MRIEVHKFGGTSVGSAERIANAARLSRDAASRCALVVVSSAMSGVTDALVGAARRAAAGQLEEATADFAAMRVRHRETAEALALPEEREALQAELEGLLDGIEALLAAVVQLGDLPPRAEDRVLCTGEKLAIRLVAAAIRAQGGKAVAVDADTFLETDGNFGSASPLDGVADRTTRAALRPLLEQGTIAVVTGFTGRAPDGATTTLGRGGSDLTATVLAAALDADEVTIWTDVDGVYSADPRMVSGARPIAHLNYREAAELSFYGAKVLHQRTMIPVVAQGIPVLTRSSLRPELPGTMVDGRFSPGSHPVKGISAVKDQALVSLEGKGMAGVPGIAARMFGALAERDISVTMISQSSSESSICIAVPSSQASAAESVLRRAFRRDLSAGLVEEVAVRPSVALVAAVGLGMAQHPRIAVRVFEAVADAEVNVLAIAQGSSELNITVAVESRDIAAAVGAIHGMFGLDRKDTGSDVRERMDVLLVGCGNVGRRVIELVEERRAHALQRFGMDIRVVGLADSSGFLFAPSGLDDVGAILAAKSSGTRVATLPGAVATSDAVDFVNEAANWRLVRPVLVDCTASPSTLPAFRAALASGMDVVTANKVPLAGSLEDYTALETAVREGGRLLRAEATVGAGLPIVDTLEMLLATGDALSSAEGCLSGTLGYVMSGLEAGQKLSEVVREAHANGYTEPDPVADLSGADVGRKATILARWTGLAPSAEVSLEGLVPADWEGLPLDELFARLETLDDAMEARVGALRERGEVLRYVAQVTADGIEVGPTAVSADSPVGRLQGTDNILVLQSERYASRPLVITGPGAGIDVTAMGVLGDLFRIAAERRT
ncbi:MAG: bifunctional aspartate kinase/homoserine dehydrogenase I [Proteobacteria bacterium]|nr:bifunctional aspartate kinase/homoserine dehydrogenase I [Pseudomonadota bacterium]